MAVVPRNAPCPCGSGSKHKLCCGETRDQERAREQALAELAQIGSRFPAVRPSSSAFEAWASGRCACTVTSALIEAGIAAVPAVERLRLVARARSEEQLVWERAGRDEAAERALLAGAVLAALAERCDPPELGLELLDEGRDPDESDAEVLALALEAEHLWSLPEAIEVDAALAALDDDLDEDAYEREWTAAVEREARRLATDEHRVRLARMVGRLEAQLPLPGHPAASDELRAACKAFAADRQVRDDLLTALLADAACLATRLAPAIAA